MVENTFLGLLLVVLVGHGQFFVRAEQAVPQLDVLRVVVLEHGVVTSVKARPENADVKVQAAVAQGADEHVGVEQHTYGGNVDVQPDERGQPQNGNGRSRKTSVEEVCRVSVTSVEPTADGIGVLVVVLVDEVVEGGVGVHDPVPARIGQGVIDVRGEAFLRYQHTQDTKGQGTTQGAHRVVGHGGQVYVK